MNWWRPSLKVQEGVFDAEGFFRTGRKPSLGFPLAELYRVAVMDEAPVHWFPPHQEKLSRPIRWKDDYFQFWAEALAIEHAGEWFPPNAWIIVAYDTAGSITACVEYRAVFLDGVLDDVAYGDALASRIGAAKHD